MNAQLRARLNEMMVEIEEIAAWIEETNQLPNNFTKIYALFGDFPGKTADFTSIWKPLFASMKQDTPANSFYKLNEAAQQIEIVLRK